jgi:transposase
MQGQKNYQEKFFVNFHLSERIPESNFYRRLKESLNLEYLRSLTAKYYGSEGQKSIDPVVFFKLMLVGYLENINSDRKIVEQSSLRMDVLYFLGYDIDEPLPWHSTLSRTRKLFGEDVFLAFFRDILRLCVDKGIVSGKTQAVDSAFIKANASFDSLAATELEKRSKKYFDEITENEDCEQNQEKPSKAKNGKKAGGKTNARRNDRYASKTDPDARVSWKPGKAVALNHLGIISVDAESHVICGATVDFADKKDSRTTESIMGQTIENMSRNDIAVETVLADAGYSSGKTYKYLEEQNITAYIPVHGGYKPQKEGFSYDKESDCYTCSKGAKLPFKSVVNQKGALLKLYYASACDCRNCPLKKQCCNKSKSRNLSHTFYKPYYDAASERINTRQGKRMARLRSATVEPVLGTLLNFCRMKKVYTIGQELARKQLFMAAATYNLKKLMNAMDFKGVKAVVNSIKNALLDKIQDWNKSISFNSKNFAMQ